MEDTGSEASSGLSEVESEDGKESQWEGKDNGRPNFKHAAPGAGKEQSTQEFFRHGNGNEARNDDDIFVTPGRQIMRGALVCSLSATTPSSGQQVGMALTLNSGEGSSKGVGREGSKGVDGRDVAVEDWVEEVVNQSEDEMEGVGRSATPSPTPGRWGSVGAVSPAGRTRPTPVPVTPTRGSKRMAMGTPRPIRHYQPVSHPGSTAGSVLKQILAAMARVERKMEEKTRKVEEAAEVAVARWDARLVERLSAVLGKVGEMEERMVARLWADAEEREKRQEVRLLALDAIQTQQVQKAKWDLKQCEDLAVIMRARQEELGEVKYGVEGIAAEIAGMRALGGPPTLAAATVRAVAPVVVGHGTPQPMEGVMVTGPPVAWMLQEDPIEKFSDMEGVEHDGLFASRYAVALSTPTSVLSSGTLTPLDWGPVPAPAREAPVEREKKTRKNKGKGKAVEIAAPPTPTCKPKGSAQQQRRQAEVDKKRAEKVRTGLRAEAVVPSAPAPVRSILK